MNKVKFILKFLILFIINYSYSNGQEYYLESYFNFPVGDIGWIEYDYKNVEFNNQAYLDSSIVLNSFEGKLTVWRIGADFKQDTLIYILRIEKEGKKIRRTFYDTLSVENVKTEEYDSVFVIEHQNIFENHGYIHGWIFPDTLYESVQDSLDFLPTYPYSILYNYYNANNDSSLYVLVDTLFIHYRPKLTNYNDSYYSIDFIINMKKDFRSFSKHYSYYGEGFYESLIYSNAGWVGVNQPIEVVNNISLSQNYPNPFNPTTQIRYSLAEDGITTLTIFNTLGEKVDEVINEYQPAGSYKVKYSAANLSSGIYFYRLNSNNFSECKKMLLLR